MASGDFELKICSFALLQLGLEAFSSKRPQFLLQGDPMSSGLLHISGAFWGLLAGIALVKAHRVDCEGWDVFALLEKRRALRLAWPRRRGAARSQHQINERLPAAMPSEEDRSGS